MSSVHSNECFQPPDCRSRSVPTLTLVCMNPKFESFLPKYILQTIIVNEYTTLVITKFNLRKRYTNMSPSYKCITWPIVCSQ